MSRFRAPENPGSKYITREGEKRLREELEHLWRIERPKVTQAVSEAAAQGDRSENAEYIYGKRRLREIDRRVRHLTSRLDGMVIVDRTPPDAGRVFFGAWVTLEADSGEELRYRIVGPDEFDREAAFISMDSPLARVLMKKGVGEQVTLDLAVGTRTFTVVAIEYEKAT